MKNPLWSSIYDLLDEVDGLLTRAERFGGGDAPASGAPSGDAPAAAVASPRKKAAFFKGYVATDDLVEVRAKIRSKLDVLKAQLAEHLTERECYLVVFPLVVLFDELVQNRFIAGGQSGSWPSLQAELFKIDDGGEVFYNTLDDLLRKPDTLPFVYEVFYLCLSDGFKGRYSDNMAKINEYKHKLETKIPTTAIPRRSEGGDAPHVVSFARVPVVRYVLTVSLAIVAYVGLRVLASYLGA